jgi:exodeoxyribonuclease VII small subunit
MEEKITFEKALSDLEQLVRQLEEGKYPLEEAISAFEKGSSLKSICEEKLKQAQFKIEQIVNKNGAVETAPFEA